MTPYESADTAAGPSKAAVPALSAYQPAAPLATQEGPLGIRFDFNEGCRVQVPLSDQPWRVPGFHVALPMNEDGTSRKDT